MMRPFFAAGSLALLGLAVSCAGAFTPRAPGLLTQRAAECRYVLPDSSPIYTEAETDTPAQPVSFGRQEYPRELRDQGIQGWVVVHFVIDAAGLIERPSIAVDSASHPAFVSSAIAMLSSTRFKAATIQGRPVAVCVQQKINWAIS